MTFYIGKEPTIGNYAKMDSISAVNGQATYNLLKGGVAFAPQSANHVICSLNSIIQNPGSSFTISGSQIIFASNLQTGDSIDFILVLGDTLSIGVPSDDTIDSAKLKTNSVIEAKIQNNAVTTDKINNDAVTIDKINLISTTSAPSLEAKGTSGQTDGYIQLNCEQNSHGIKLKSPSHSSSQSYTIIMPDNQIAQDKVMKVKSITGSGSTAVGQLEFADAGGGDLVKLFHNKLTTNASLQQINGYFDDTIYASYIAKAYNVGGSSNAHPYFRVMVGGNEHTGSDYWSAMQGNFNNNSAQNTQERADNSGSNYSHLGATWDLSSTNSQRHFYTLEFFTPQSTSLYKIFKLWSWGNGHGSSTAYHWHNQGIITVKTTSALTGIQFSPASGNFTADSEFVLYGVKK